MVDEAVKFFLDCTPIIRLPSGLAPPHADAGCCAGSCTRRDGIEHARAGAGSRADTGTRAGGGGRRGSVRRKSLHEGLARNPYVAKGNTVAPETRLAINTGELNFGSPHSPCLMSRLPLSFDGSAEAVSRP